MIDARIPSAWLAVLLAAGLLSAQTHGADRDTASQELVTRRGRVVWLADALQRLHGAQTVPEARQRALALETPQGALYPLVEDTRGRAFREDPRLRDIDIELLAVQHPQSMLLQVVKIFAIEGEQRYELDYWCEICSIAMFELKACDCCQGPIELRRRSLSPSR